MNKTTLLVILVIVLHVLAACEKQFDRNGILSERAMVDVLYDYQLALSLSGEAGGTEKMAETEYRYTQAVFAKHGITEDVFNLSVAHYARDPKQMLSITKKVSERYAQEVQSQENAAQQDRNEQFAAQSDTVVIWENRHGIFLSADGNNHYRYEFSAKQIPRKSDMLMFAYRPSWIYKEGSRQGTVLMTVNYDNDSTDVRVESIRDFNQNQGTRVALAEGRKVKSVFVDVYQGAMWKDYPQVLHLYDLALWSIYRGKNGK